MTKFNKIAWEMTSLVNILIRMIKMKVTTKRQVNYDVDKELHQSYIAGQNLRKYRACLNIPLGVGNREKTLKPPS